MSPLVASAHLVELPRLRQHVEPRGAVQHEENLLQGGEGRGGRGGEEGEGRRERREGPDLALAQSACGATEETPVDSVSRLQAQR